MLKKFFIVIRLSLFLMFCRYATAGNLFNVTTSGVQIAPYNITLCLNGMGPLSCQNYVVSALELAIQTTIPNHVYRFAGIKNNNSGYTVLNCTTPSSNGYCLFSASNTSTASISMYPLNRVIGDISGLTNNGLVLQNNGGNYLTIKANTTAFSFTDLTPIGSHYNVTVQTQPTREFCTVNNGSGVNTNGIINQVSVNCTPVPIAYITSTAISPNSDAINYCALTASNDPSVNGTIDTCTSTPLTPPSDWRVYGLSFATIDTNPYAYVVDNNNLSINICNVITSTGAFGTCPVAMRFQYDLKSFQPTGVNVGTIGETQYVYVSTNVRNALFSCTIADSAGHLNCGEPSASGPPSTPTTTPVPTIDPSRFWSPWSSAIANVNNTPYGYVVAPLDSEVYLCFLTVPYDGTFSSCVDGVSQIPSGQQPPSWAPTATAFATVNNTTYAYIVDTNNNTAIWRCSIKNDGYFDVCTKDYTFNTSGASRLGISIATVKGTLYAYVSNPSTSNPAVYQCTINTSSSGFGQIEGCNSIYSLPASEPFSSITMQAISDPAQL